MIAEDNKAMQTASQALFEYAADWLIQEKCPEREEYNRIMRTNERDKSVLKEALVQKESELAEKDKVLAEKDKALIAEQEEKNIALEENAYV